MNQNPDLESIKQPVEQLKPFSEPKNNSENNATADLSDSKLKSSDTKSPRFKYGASQPSQLIFKNMSIPSAYHDTELSPKTGGTKIICKETILEIDEGSPVFVSEPISDFENQITQHVGQRSPQKLQQPIGKYVSQDPREPREAEEYKNYVKKKKKVAKDDTMQDTNKWKALKSSFEGPRNNYFEPINESPSSPTRQNIFFIDRSKNERQPTSMRLKRKMSATYINQQSQNYMPDLAEESEPEFDLTQSLLTLQLKNPSRPVNFKQQSQSFNQWDKSKKVENNLRGITKDIHLKESLLRKNSNFANGSNLETDNMSDLSQVKDLKSIADNQDSDLESVSLEDPELENIGKIKIVTNGNGSTRTINFNLQQAIEQAEIIEEADSMKSNQPETAAAKEEVQTEEYESLVWGQSIWSTDVPKDSKKQFIQKLHDIVISQEIDGDLEIENDEDDFEDIQKKIQEQTNQEEMPFNQPEPMQSMQMLSPIYEFNAYSEQPSFQISQGQHPSGQQDYYNMHHQNYSVQPPEFETNEIHHHVNYQNIDQSQVYSNCGNSVHSGGHLNFPGHHQMGLYNVTPNLNADAASSNFTHHPYSQYNQEPAQTFENSVNPHMLPNNYNQHNGNNAGYNAHNRDHIFINRQINKYMMNPIYKSKQTVTSLQMHRFTGVPWRGGTGTNNLNNMNAYHQTHHQQNPHHVNSSIDSMPGELQNVQQSTELVDHRFSPDNMMLNLPKDEQFQFQYIESPSQVEETLDAQPFYPKNYGEQQRKKQQTINDSANILAAGKSARQKTTPAIHVPIPIPIMRNQKLKQESQKAEHPKNQVNSIFMNDFYRDDMLMKKHELDKRMQETMQNLESKVIKAVQINDEEDNDEEEEEDLTFEVLSQHELSESGVSIERPESALNKSINFKELKHHLGGTQQINFRNLQQLKRKSSDQDNNEVKELKENKIKQYEEKIKKKSDRAAIFKKLQSQLSEFKTEMFTNSEPKDILLSNVASSVSPKRTSNSKGLLPSGKLTPFKQDAKQYMDKVLNFMNIINEVDDLTNVAELKNKLEKQKLHLLKARAERDEVVNQLQYLQQTHRTTEYQFREKETTYKQQQNENLAIIQTLQQTMIQDREQHVLQIYSLTQSLDTIRQESQSLMLQNSQMSENQNIQDQTIFNLHNKISKLNNQLEQNNHNNYQLTSTLNQLQSENQQLQQDQENMEKEWVRKVDIVNRPKNGQFESDYSNINGGEEDEDDVPLHEQLENANQQIKDLQEYIKKRGFEDLKNNQLRQDAISKNEIAHQDKFSNLKKLKDQMEKEKDKVIQRLKEFIINHNDPMLIGSCGSSMYSQSEEKKEDQLRIQDQSTIEAPSMDSFDNKGDDDYVRMIMNDYSCEKCEEKDRIILNNEQRITDYIAYIQKQSIQKSFREVQKSSVLTQTDIDVSLNTSNSSQDKSLRSCHKILLSNFIRQFRVYLDNLDDEESEKTSQMLQKLSLMAVKQKITLFHEEEDPDTSLVTKDLIQEIMSMSLDMIMDLLVFSNEESTSATPVFKTIEFGLNFDQLKEMQNVARVERKSCHQIIVAIEKLMYDMNNLMGKFPDNDAVLIFGQILDTYLQLPHRLKPIFDHCKKIETVVLKALKSQDQIVKSVEQAANK